MGLVNGWSRRSEMPTGRAVGELQEYGDNYYRWLGQGQGLPPVNGDENNRGSISGSISSGGGGDSDTVRGNVNGGGDLVKGKLGSDDSSDAADVDEADVAADDDADVSCPDIGFVFDPDGQVNIHILQTSFSPP